MLAMLLNMILMLVGWVIMPVLLILGSVAVMLFRNRAFSKTLKDGQEKLRKRTQRFDPNYIESEFIDDVEDGE